MELTGHYYAEGPPDSPAANITNLLKTDSRIAESMDRIMPVAREYRLSYRMSEGNSCYRGGKPGMSNALASALWGMDFMLDLGARGCAGINLHGGGGGVIAAALGNKLLGARDARDLEIAELGTFYSPVAGNPQLGYSARPIFYGMMAVEMFAGCTLVGTELDSSGANLTAYAGRKAGSWRIALINKDLTRDVTARVELPAKMERAAAWRLTGPAPDATGGVRFAGSEAEPRAATWTPRAEAMQVRGRAITIGVPRASAVVITSA